MTDAVVSTKLKKDDLVQIISGKERGKQGKIVRIDMAKNRAIIQGLNMVKKAMRKRKQNDRGGIVEIEAPVRLCNMMIVCKKCGITRIGRDEATKKRICRKCGGAL